MTPREEYEVECAARDDGDPAAGLIVAVLAVATVVCAALAFHAAWHGAPINGWTLWAFLLTLTTLRVAYTTATHNPREH